MSHPSVFPPAHSPHPPHPATGARRRYLPQLRWWIGGLLFASTVVNYLDRQALSALAPFLKQEYQWTNEDYALIVVAFRLAYAIGQTLCGRWIDRVGTRYGLTLTVLSYSVVAMLTSLAGGLRSFIGFRFVLGLCESANWPAATKAVAEWFPRQERGWAVALFDSGSSIGAAIAPSLVIGLYHTCGNWRFPFLIIGALGFLWLIAWRWLYHAPEHHPRLSPEERALILREREDAPLPPATPAAPLPAPSAAPHRPQSLRELLSLRQTWGVIICRSFTDPVWFFIADWFMIFLVSRGFQPEKTLLAFWIPFVAADLGNFAGGGFSSWLIRRGWSVGRARRAVVVFGALGMTLLVPTLYCSDLFALAGLFALATFSYAAYSTIALVLPSDLYRRESVATVSGLSGTVAGAFTIVSTLLIGRISEHHSFAPILIAASIIPLVGGILVLWLVRNTAATDAGALQRI